MKQQPDQQATALRSDPQPRGVALVIVLWIITLLSLISASFIRTMRTDIHIVTNSVARAKAETIADAAIHRALYELYKPANILDRWIPDGTTRQWQHQDATVNLIMTDESGKIDINTASDALLRGLLKSQDVAEQQVLELSDAIADWRDADSAKRINGAEEADYAAAGLSYKPTNIPFQTIEELKLVLGMTPALYQKLAPLITIYSRLPGINAQIATREVLRAIPNVTEEQIDAYLQLREAARANKQPIPIFAAGAPYLSGNTGGFIVNLRADARLPEGTAFIREAIAIRHANPKRPFAFLVWRESREPIAAPNTDPGNNS